MKRCPKCNQDFSDDYSFCLSDGSSLLSSPSFNEIPTIVIPPPTQIAPQQKGVNPAFIYAAVGFFALLLGGAVVAFVLYGLNNQNNPVPNTNYSPVNKTVQNENRKEVSNSDDEISKQKEDLQKREEKLRREKERLENEKKDLAANKTIPPTTENTSTATMATVFAPPTNIRESPNGAILCLIKKRTSIEILGSTGVRDNNGLWYYTSACGKTGVVHSTQIRF